MLSENFEFVIEPMTCLKAIDYIWQNAAAHWNGSALN